MKTNKLKKYRKRAEKKIKLTALYNWDRGMFAYKVIYGKNRGRTFPVDRYEEAKELTIEKRREYILNEVKDAFETPMLPG